MAEKGLFNKITRRHSGLENFGECVFAKIGEVII